MEPSLLEPSSTPGSTVAYVSNDRSLLVALRHRPLVSATLAFIAGITLADVPQIALALVITGLAATALLRTRTARATVLLLAVLVAAGGARAWIAMRPSGDDVSLLVGPGQVTISGRVCSDVAENHGAWSCRIDVYRARLPDGRQVSCSGEIAACIRHAVGDRSPEFGDSVSVHGRLQTSPGPGVPGAYDFAAYDRRHGVFATLTASRPFAFAIDREPPVGIALGQRLALGCRRAFEDSLRRCMAPLEAALVSGITLGGREDLPRGLGDDFGITGTAHILAASGMNVMIMAIALAMVLRWTPLRPRGVSLVSLIGLAFYTAVAGAQPSVVRADVMVSLYLAGTLLDREPDAPTAVSVAALLLLLADPGDLFDPGFQLSFVVAGALIGCSRLRWRSGSVPRGAPASVRVRHLASDWLWVSTVAQIAAAPLIAQHWNMIPLAGVAANALIAPLVAPIMWIALALWAVSFLAPQITALVAACTLIPMAQYVIGAVHAFATLPMSAISVPSPGWPALFVIYGAAGMAIRWILARQTTDRIGVVE